MLATVLPEEFFVVAHRGASAYEPENTIPAVLRAIEMGAQVVEVDVRRCRSGELVVFHDEDLARLLGVQARVSSLTLSELKVYRVGGRAEIPTLAEVLDEVRGRVKLFVEIKERGTEAQALELVRSRGMLDDVVFISFHQDVLTNVRGLEPAAHLGYLTAYPRIGIGGLLRSGIEVLLPRYNIVTGRMVREARARGMRVVPWVVNDVAVAVKLRNLGVDGIATDRPDILTQVSKLV